MLLGITPPPLMIFEDLKKKKRNSTSKGKFIHFFIDAFICKKCFRSAQTYLTLQKKRDWGGRVWTLFKKMYTPEQFNLQLGKIQLLLFLLFCTLVLVFLFVSSSSLALLSSLLL